MAGKPQYSDAEILWFVKQVFEYKIKNEDLVCEGFKARFGRELKSHQHKYLKGRYGKDPAYNCPAITGFAFLAKPAISQKAQLPILPLGQDYTVMSCNTIEAHGNVDQILNSSQTMEGYGNVGQSLNSSQTMEGYSNVGQSLNGGSSGMAGANHYTTARYSTANNTPRQTTEAPVPVPRQAGLSGSSTMHTASRISRSERRRQAARAAAYQQAQAAVHADEQVERQLQNRQQVREARQTFERLRMPGMSGAQYPTNQTPMLWPQANVPPSTQQTHFSHGTHHAPRFSHQEIFANEQHDWTMNSYSGHQLPVTDYTQQATYMGNHGQELETQRWIETQEDHLQGQQSAAPVVYMDNHGQELETGPWNVSQEPHAAPETVFRAPEQVSWEVVPQLGALEMATIREAEENQQEPGQGMQNPYERSGEPYPSPALSHRQSHQSIALSRGESQQSMALSYGEPQQSMPPLYRGLQQSEPLSRRESQQSMSLSYRGLQQSEPLSRRESQQSMPLLRGDSQQSMPLSRGDSQQSMPLSEEGHASSRTLQDPTPVRHASPFSYQVISIQHLQQLLAGTSDGTENAKKQDDEVDDFNFADFLNLESVL